MTNGVSEVIISNLAKEMNNNNRRGEKVFKSMYICLTQGATSCQEGERDWFIISEE